MKTNLLTIVFLIIGKIIFAQSYFLPFDSKKSGKEETLPERVVTDIGNGLEVEYNFIGATVSDIEVENKIYNILRIDGFGLAQNVGKPNLPIRNDIIDMPLNSRMVITIIDTVSMIYDDYYLHPTLQPAYDHEGEPEPEFEINEELYSTNEFYPQKLVTLSDVQYLRQNPLGFVDISPVQFNPVTRQVKVYSKIKYRIEYVDANYSPDFEVESATNFLNFKNRFILNPNELIEPEHLDNGLFDNSKSYIIITTDEFLEAAIKLAKWKRQLGYTVEVVSQNTWTSTQVKEEIHTRYWNWNPKPDYFVIIGDHEDVPGEEKSSSYGTWATDLYYACMDGSSDYIPDMAYGRISVSSLNEANNVIDKIINYEKEPVQNTNFYQNGMNCAYFQHAGDGYAQRRFAHTSEEIRDYVLSQNYDVERVYFTHNTVNPTNWNNGHYSDGQPIPNELLRSSGFAWDGDNTDIIKGINNGKFYVLHRDHGGYNGWGDPSFTTSDINALTNQDLTPVVFSINCLTGGFYKTECFTEKFLRHNNGGAVGVIGASSVSYSGYNDALAVGFFDAIWANPGLMPNFGSGGVSNPSVNTHEDIVTMGDVLNHGKLRMSQTWGTGAAQYQYELFHYFGDPAMKIWTEYPIQLTANHSSSIEETATTLSISNCNTDNATATLMAGDILISRTVLTGNSGELQFEIPPGNYTELLLTISKRNHKPYITTININQINPPIQENWTHIGSSDDINVLTEEGDFLWVGSEGGLTKINRQTNEQTFYSINNSGLPNMFIKDIAIDNNGSKWIGTENGLAKFDGTNWTVYTTQNSQIPNDTITTIGFDSQNNVWLGTMNGLAKFDGTNWQIFNTSNSELLYNKIKKVAVDNSDNIWIGTGWDIIYKYTGNEWIVTNVETSFGHSTGRQVSDIEIDNFGNVWTCFHQGWLFKFDGNNWTFYNSENSGLLGGGTNNESNLSEIDFDTNNDLWIGYSWSNRMQKYNGTEWFDYELESYALTSLYVSEDNIIWMGKVGSYSGLYKSTDGISLQNIKLESEWLRDSHIIDIDADNNGNLWIASSNGLTKYDGLNWIFFNAENSDIPQNWIKDIEIDNYGNIWLACFHNLVKYDGANWTIYNVENNAPSNSYSIDMIRIDNNNNIWLANKQFGLLKFDGTDFTIFNSSNSILPDDNIYDMQCDSEGNIWVATGQYGLFKYGQNNWEVFNTNNSQIPSNSVLTIEISSTNIIYGGIYLYPDGGIFSFDGENWIYNNHPRYVSSIAIDENNNKWIGCDGLNGLFKLNENNIFTSYCIGDFYPNEVTKITIDNTNKKIIGTKYDGLFILEEIVNNDFTVSVSQDNYSLINGNSVTLTATGGAIYSWQPVTGLNTTSGNTVIANPTETTTYFVTATDSYGNISTAETTIKVFPQPTTIEVSGELDFEVLSLDTIITTDLTVTNTGVSDLIVSDIRFPDDISTTWYGGILSAGASQNIPITFNPSELSSYSEQFKVYSNAISGTDTIKISIASVTGIEEIENKGKIKAWYNPQNQSILIENNENLELNYKITNVIGQILQSGSINRDATEIKVTNIHTTGVYLLILQGNNYIQTEKLMIK